MKLLIDENLSARVAVELQREGFDVVHVRERGLLGATDPEVLQRAYDEDRILVTSNVGDFVKLARARDLHPGIVLVEDAGLPRDEQMRVVKEAIERLQAEQQAGRDLINRVLRLWSDGEAIFEHIPPP